MNRRNGLIALLLLTVLQAALLQARLHEWGVTLSFAVISCAVLVPLHFYVTRTRKRAVSAAFWLFGFVFAFPAFALGSMAVGAYILAPIVVDKLAPWLPPERTRLIVVVVSLIPGFVTAVLAWWAAWIKFPLSNRAA